ncbi:MAG: extracellular solute-binding protein [Spirochaetaceae bacterium]|nr:MAG: extracellular solute-binding protein [Spirochaetaceae bacterium]
MVRKILLVSVIIFTLLPVMLLAEAQGEVTTGLSGKIRVVGTTITRDPDGLLEWQQEFKKVTGVSIDFIAPPHTEYGAVVRKMFATGEKMDVIEVLVGDYTTFAAQGVLFPLDDLIAKSTIVKSVNPKFLAFFKMKDGHTYGFPVNAGGGCVLFLRQDWLTKLGLKAPATYDEFNAMLKAFTNNDPDGNGKKDTYGYTMSMNVPVSEFDYYQRFFMLDARFDFLNKGGKWVDGFTEPEMVKALERFQTAYKEGLIDSEFFTNATSTSRTKFFEGRCGAMEYWSGLWADRMQAGVVAINPKASSVPVGIIQGAYYIARPSPAFSIYAKSANPELAFKAWMETSVDGGKGQTLFTYGVKGVHYDISGGKMTMLPLRSNPKAKFEKAYVEAALIVNDYKRQVPLSALAQLSRDIHVRDAEPIPFVPGGEIYAKQAAEIGKVKFQIFSKICAGELSVEAGLKSYRDQVAGLKMAEVIAELNK